MEDHRVDSRSHLEVGMWIRALLARTSKCLSCLCGELISGSGADEFGFPGLKVHSLGVLASMAVFGG